MDVFEKYLNLALRYLSYRPRSEKEVRDNLRKITSRKKVEKVEEVEKIIDQVIAKLKENKFLDDKEFVKWWVDSRLRFRPRSINLIKRELLQKGIDRDLVDPLIHNSEFIIQNDLDRAKELVQKKIYKYQRFPKLELYQKLGAFLARRGFDWDTIKKAIDDTLKKGV